MQFDNETTTFEIGFFSNFRTLVPSPSPNIEGEGEGHAGPIIGEGAGGQFGWGFLFLGSRARSVIYESKNLFFFPIHIYCSLQCRMQNRHKCIQF